MNDNTEMDSKWNDFQEALRKLWDHFHPGIRNPGEKVPYIDHVEADLYRLPLPPAQKEVAPVTPPPPTPAPP